jgi:DNA-binding NtrC family response regulator
MAATERDIIIAALKRNGYNKSQTAEELGISRKTIYNKMAEYQIVLDGD